jgi:hypothetical protein
MKRDKILKGQPEKIIKSKFKRVTITMSPELLFDLKVVSAKLQEHGYKDTDVSSLIRIAIHHFLKDEITQTINKYCT